MSHLEASAKSNSSNGSSLTKEIFCTIPQSFDHQHKSKKESEQIIKEDADGPSKEEEMSVFSKKRSGSSSTEESSELTKDKVHKNIFDMF